jgi:ATP-dependent Zn protease
MNEWSVEDNSQISPETRQVIDAEVQRLVTEQYERAQALLKDHCAALKISARQPLKQETVSSSVVKEALENSSSLGSPAAGGHIEKSHAKR